MQIVFLFLRKYYTNVDILVMTKWNKSVSRSELLTTWIPDKDFEVDLRRINSKELTVLQYTITTEIFRNEKAGRKRSLKFKIYYWNQSKPLG